MHPIFRMQIISSIGDYLHEYLGVGTPTRGSLKNITLNISKSSEIYLQTYEVVIYSRKQSSNCYREADE